MTFDKAGSLSSGSDLLEMSFLVLTTGHEDILKIKEMFFFFFFSIYQLKEQLIILIIVLVNQKESLVFILPKKKKIKFTLKWKAI